MFKKSKAYALPDPGIEDGPLADKVVCEDCHCWLSKNDAQKVAGPFRPYYYCGSDRKKYSRVYLNRYSPAPIKYYGEVEMDSEGVPVGYEKIKDKK